MREAEKPRPLTWRTRALARIVYAVGRTLVRSLRLTVVGLEEHEAAIRRWNGGIQAAWHGRTLVGGHFFSHRGHWALVSLSRDGDIQTRHFELMGYRVIRGSTGRGAVRATLEVVQALRAGGVLSFTPDGPRGPSGVAQPGVVYFAQKTGRPILPVGTAAASAWRLGTWDGYLIPRPFSRCVVVLGEPVEIGRDEEVEAACARVSRALDAAQAAAEEALSAGRGASRTP